MVRNQWRADGIFSVIYDEFNEFVCHTLEHSYAEPPSFFAKIPLGVYTCKRGEHDLAHSPKSFETFEITGVPGHSGLIYHVGNFNNDSNGCILVGLNVGTINEQLVLTNSKAAFAKLMALQVNCDEFILTVKDS